MNQSFTSMNKFTLTLDASQIYEFQMCPLKWYYKYRQNLRLAGETMEAADKGTLIHNLCDLYYNLNWLDPEGSKFVHKNEAIRIFQETKATKKLFPSDNGDLEYFLCSRFDLYVTRWFNNDFKLPATKSSPVELGFTKPLYEDRDVRFLVEGRIDLLNLILEDRLCFTDHKTQERDSELYNYTPQFKTYAWACGCEYGIINYIGLQKEIKKDGRSFRRQLINIPKWMHDEWEEKMLRVFWNITRYLTDLRYNEFDEKFQEQRIYIDRNDSYCGGAFNCNPCAFTYLCECNNWEAKANIKGFKYNKVEHWTPWSIKEGKVAK